MPLASVQTDYAEVYSRSLRDPQGFWGNRLARFLGSLNRKQCSIRMKTVSGAGSLMAS